MFQVTAQYNPNSNQYEVVPLKMVELALLPGAGDAFGDAPFITFMVKHADIGFERPIVSCQNGNHVVCKDFPKYIFDVPMVPAEDKEYFVDENGHNYIRVARRSAEKAFVLVFSCISSEKTNQGDKDAARRWILEVTFTKGGRIYKTKVPFQVLTNLRDPNRLKRDLKRKAEVQANNPVRQKQIALLLDAHKARYAAMGDEELTAAVSGLGGQ